MPRTDPARVRSAAKAQIMGFFDASGVINTLGALKLSTVKRIAKPAVYQAMNHPLAMAIAIAPVRKDPEFWALPGALKRAIRKMVYSPKWGKYAKGVRGMLYVSKDENYQYYDEFGEQKWNKPTKYAHLVEKGHGGPRAAPPYPFFSRAMEATAGQVKETLAATAKARIKSVLPMIRRKGRTP
jgi:hypothetical protein